MISEGHPPRQGPGPTTFQPWASYTLRSSTRMNLNSHAVATGNPLRFLAREVLPPGHDYVAVGRIKLHEETLASCLLGPDQRRTAAPEQIQDVLAGTRRVLHRPNGELHRLLGQMDHALRVDL